MSRAPSMFGTFTITVDGGGELYRGTDALRQPHEIRMATLSHSRLVIEFLGSTATAEDMVSEYSDDGLVHLPAPNARVAFSPALDTSISPTFSNFSPSTSSGYSIPSPDPVSAPSDPDDAWNLIPYNVSWGHEYEEYRAGILPGPEGDCIFLRSPTPLRNQRASEACKKCRERKAKVCLALFPRLVAAVQGLSCSVPELALHVLVAPRVITTVNMHLRPPPLNLQALLRSGDHTARPGNQRPGMPSTPTLFITPSRQRYPNSCHFNTPITRARTGRAPPQVTTVR
jgi:hypothetical protein